jgi:hypothetical protein
MKLYFSRRKGLITASNLRAGRWNVFFPIPQKLFPPGFDFADLEIAKRSAYYRAVDDIK